MACAFAEGAVTRLRREFKLLLNESDARGLVLCLEKEAAATRTWITSVYFDRPGLPLTARAHASPNDCLKIRTKEYFPDVDGGDAPRVVLEAKRERNGLTQKQRVWVPRADLAPLEERGALWSQLPLVEAGTLFPVLAVTYVRDVYQHSEAWRVTVDREVSFHTVDAQQALGRTRLGTERLAPPFARVDQLIVEVKHLGEELPTWLAALRQVATAQFSKFAEGTARLERARADGAQGGNRVHRLRGDRRQRQDDAVQHAGGQAAPARLPSHARA